jgi:hypothetical protein
MGDWEQRELYRMFIMNDEPLYRQQEYMNQNLARKKYKGIYNPALAPKLFGYLIDRAIKEYNRQLPDSKISLTKEDKTAVAAEMVEDFEERFKNNEFEPYKQKYLLKKKGKSGWVQENARHSLARKGIKTGRKKK